MRIISCRSFTLKGQTGKQPRLRDGGTNELSNGRADRRAR